MQFDRSAKLAMVTAIVLMGASGVGLRAVVKQLNIYLRKESVPLRGPFTGIPSRLGDWQQVGSDTILPDPVVEELGTSQYLDRLYAIDGDFSKGAIQLHLAYYTGVIDAVPHVPERCWVAGGMTMTEQVEVLPLDIDRTGWRTSAAPANRATAQPYQETQVQDLLRGSVPVHLPQGELQLRTTEFQSEANPDRRLIGGYLFIANGRATPSALAVRSLAFEKTDRFAYYCKVQFSMPVSSDDPDRLAHFAAQASDLLSHLLPHLMLRLPDWPDIESIATGAEPVTTSSSTGS